MFKTNIRPDEDLGRELSAMKSSVSFRLAKIYQKDT